MAAEGSKPDDSFPPRVGPYRLDARLGAGGMGEVYRGHDPRLDRPVALKRVRPDARDPDKARYMFRREARLVARLNHPTITQVHDLLEDPEGDWLVMELVTGQTLSQHLQEREFSPSEAMKIGAGIATGLAAAHDAGLVHRDLKTDNVMLTPSGGVKILDFGIARRLPDEDGSPLTTTLSREGVLVGTVVAMSPEQAAGQKVDHRSDLFSLGSLLYQLLTGDPPFVGNNAYETLSRICLSKEVPVHELEPDVPRAVSRFVAHLLQKDPDGRPQSAAEVVDMAERLAQDPETNVSPDLEELEETLAQGELAPFAGDAAKAAAMTTGRMVCTFLTSELADNAWLLGRLGDPAVTGTLDQHRTLMLGLLERHHGRQIEQPEGFVAFFDRPDQAVRWALDYHTGLRELPTPEDETLGARVGVHTGDVVLKARTADEIQSGMPPFEVSGPAQTQAEHYMRLASRGQTLVSREIYDQVHETPLDAETLAGLVRWHGHSTYRVSETNEIIDVFEVGVEGLAPWTPPANTGQIQRWTPPAPRSRRLASMAAIIVLVLVLVGAGAYFWWINRPPPELLYVALPETVVSAPEARLEELQLKAGAVHSGLLQGLLGYHRIAVVEPPAHAAPTDDPKLIANELGTDEVLTSELLCTAELCQIVLKRVRGADGSLVWHHKFTEPNLSLLDWSYSTASQLRAGYSEFRSDGAEPDFYVSPEDFASYLSVRQELKLRNRNSAFEELIRRLTRLRESSPRFVEAYLQAAGHLRVRFSELRDRAVLEQAEEILELGLTVAPQDPRLLREMATLQMDTGQVDKASATLAIVEALQPGDASLMARRALILELQGKAVEALELMKESVRRQPSWAQLAIYSDMARRSGKVELAKETLALLLEKSPENYSGLARLADIELVAGSLERAVELYRQLVDLSSDAVDLSNLGVAYLLVRDYEKAMESFRLALEQAPDSPGMLLNLADAELLAGNEELALARYGAVIEQVDKDPNATSLLTIKAQAQARLGRLEQAAGSIQSALGQAPENPQVLYEAALVYALIGEQTSALINAKKCLEMGVEPRWFDFPWFDTIRPRLLG